MHASLISFVFAAFAAAAPVPAPAADPKPQSWYASTYNSPPPPTSPSWFGSPAPAPKPAAGITLTGPPGTSHFGSDGSVALSNGVFGVAYSPGTSAPPARGYGAWKVNTVAETDGAQEKAVGEAGAVEGEQALPTADE